MRAVNAAIAGLAAAGLLLATGGSAAQTSQAIQDAPVIISGQLIPTLNVDPGEKEHLDPVVEDGRRIAPVESVRGEVWEHAADLDDPRLAGTMTMSWNWDDFDPITDTSVAWGTVTIENEGGSWSGTFTGVEYPTGLVDAHAWLAGDGAYAGLAAFLCIQCPFHGGALPYDGDAGSTLGVDGLLFRGAPPAFADEPVLVGVTGTAD
jgi:hypothetical protein